MAGFLGFIAHCTPIVSGEHKFLPYSGYVAGVTPQEQWDNIPLIGKLQILIAIGMLESYGEGAGDPAGYTHYMKGGKPGYYPPIAGRAGFGQVGINLWDVLGNVEKMSPEKKARGLKGRDPQRPRGDDGPHGPPLRLVRAGLRALPRGHRGGTRSIGQRHGALLERLSSSRDCRLTDCRCASGRSRTVRRVFAVSCSCVIGVPVHGPRVASSAAGAGWPPQAEASYVAGLPVPLAPRGPPVAGLGRKGSRRDRPTPPSFGRPVRMWNWPLAPLLQRGRKSSNTSVLLLAGKVAPRVHRCKADRAQPTTVEPQRIQQWPRSAPRTPPSSRLGAKAVEVLRPVLYYGFLPTVILIGMRTEPRPSPRRPVHAHLNGADTRRHQGGRRRSGPARAGRSVSPDLRASTLNPFPHDLPNSIPVWTPLCIALVYRESYESALEMVLLLIEAGADVERSM